MSKFLLRPHHLLCLRFFEGKGYSEAFTLRATEVLGALNDGASVQLTDGCDALCEACPHNRGDCCDTSEKVARYDHAVLSLCGLRVGERGSWASMQAMVSERMAGKLSDVCEDCEWFGICSVKGL